MQAELSLMEQLSYSTIRIECQLKDGKTGTGTGFFFNFIIDEEKGLYTPVIITNKHVVKNAKRGKLIFSKTDVNGQILDTEHALFESPNFEDMWLAHPDKDVDLCALPIMPIINRYKTYNINLAFRSLNAQMIAPVATGSVMDLDAVEDVIMVGYPNGL